MPVAHPWIPPAFGRDVFRRSGTSFGPNERKRRSAFAAAIWILLPHDALLAACVVEMSRRARAAFATLEPPSLIRPRQPPYSRPIAACGTTAWRPRRTASDRSPPLVFVRRTSACGPPTIAGPRGYALRSSGPSTKPRARPCLQPIDHVAGDIPAEAVQIAHWSFPFSCYRCRP